MVREHPGHGLELLAVVYAGVQAKLEAIATLNGVAIQFPGRRHERPGSP